MSFANAVEIDKNMPTAVVTGGSRGIGREIVRVLSRDGFQILFTYRSRTEEATETAQVVRESGGKVFPYQMDVAEAEAVHSFFADLAKEKVNLAVLVNNAGRTKDGLLLRMKDEDFDAVVNVNLRGAFVCTREAVKIMSKLRHGRIINIASVVGQSGNAGQANYAASKAGLIGLTKSCAKEFASRQITCNAVAPGFIETDMTACLPEEIRHNYVEQIPLKRMGTASDVAEAVAFLASDRAGYITGQVLAVNGGMYC